VPDMLHPSSRSNLASCIAAVPTRASWADIASSDEECVEEFEMALPLGDSSYSEAPLPGLEHSQDGLNKRLGATQLQGFFPVDFGFLSEQFDERGPNNPDMAPSGVRCRTNPVAAELTSAQPPRCPTSSGSPILTFERHARLLSGLDDSSTTVASMRSRRRSSDTARSTPGSSHSSPESFFMTPPRSRLGSADVADPNQPSCLQLGNEFQSERKSSRDGRPKDKKRLGKFEYHGSQLKHAKRCWQANHASGELEHPLVPGEMPEASEEDWQRRIDARLKAVDLGKATHEYSAYASSVPRGARRAGEPMTPETSDRTISKRKWKYDVQQWRAGLRSWHADRNCASSSSFLPSEHLLEEPIKTEE